MLEATRYQILSQLIDREGLAAKRATTPEERIAHSEVQLLLIETRAKWEQAARAAKPTRRRTAPEPMEAAE